MEWSNRHHSRHPLTKLKSIYTPENVKFHSIKVFRSACYECSRSRDVVASRRRSKPATDWRPPYIWGLDSPPLEPFPPKPWSVWNTLRERNYESTTLLIQWEGFFLYEFYIWVSVYVCNVASKLYFTKSWNVPYLSSMGNIYLSYNISIFRFVNWDAGNNSFE